MKWPPKKSSEQDGSTTSALLPPQDVSSEKFPDTPEAGPTTSEAVKHEQEVPSVPCTTVTTSSVLTTSTLFCQGQGSVAKIRQILVPPLRQ